MNCKSRCKDCIHSDICHSGTSECDFFIDKRSIFQVPCNIGDYVYEVTPLGTVLKKKIAGFHYNTVGKQKGLHLIAGCICGMQERIKDTKIGVTVFCNQADAELAAGRIINENKQRSN